jgi:DNA-binding response OmpR family regulator
VESPRDNQGKVLLVDDDPDLLRLLAIRLKSAGHDVATADSRRRHWRRSRPMCRS